MDIAIIGGGPAGLAAGLYAARAGMDVTLFEEAFVGGQTAKIDKIDNYPGFPNGLDGVTLSTSIREQAQRFGLKISNAAVESLALDGKTKLISTYEGKFEAKAVIIATGASPRKLNIENEEKLTGAGVSYCATCDGAFFRGMDVAVIGGGDTAVSDALYLARFVNKVYLIHRRDELRASYVLAQAALAEKKIQPVWDTVPEGFVGRDMLDGIAVRNVKTGETQTLAVQGAFVAVGVVPRTELVKDTLTLAKDGSIITDERMQTSLEGVYAAGDVRKTPLRQVVTAVADGAVAASMAAEYINV